MIVEFCIRFWVLDRYFNIFFVLEDCEHGVDVFLGEDADAVLILIFKGKADGFMVDLEGSLDELYYMFVIDLVCVEFHVLVVLKYKFHLLSSKYKLRIM